jgi:hypothetical protein
VSQQEGEQVETIGIITVGSAVMAAVVAAAVVFRSVPDIRHYRRIRNM